MPADFKDTISLSLVILILGFSHDTIAVAVVASLVPIGEIRATTGGGGSLITCEQLIGVLQAQAPDTLYTPLPPNTSHYTPAPPPAHTPSTHYPHHSPHHYYPASPCNPLHTPDNYYNQFATGTRSHSPHKLSLSYPPSYILISHHIFHRSKIPYTPPASVPRPSQRSLVLPPDLLKSSSLLSPPKHHNSLHSLDGSRHCIFKSHLFPIAHPIDQALEHQPIDPLVHLLAPPHLFHPVYIYLYVHKRNKSQYLGWLSTPCNRHNRLIFRWYRAYIMICQVYARCNPQNRAHYSTRFMDPLHHTR